MKGEHHHGKNQSREIADIRGQIAQLENRPKELIQEQELQDRNAHTKRLCNRMGLSEGLLPDDVARFFLQSIYSGLASFMR